MLGRHYNWLARRDFLKHESSRALFDIVIRKQTNLCVSADVSSSKELIELVDAVGPYVCLIKTHIDIINDFTPELIDELKVLAKKHEFMIFEDRKFADLGSTVQKQFSEGIYKINSWSDFINAHTVVGSGIIKGLESVSRGQGLILIAQMSAAGNMCSESYTEDSVRLAEENDDFVCGFICTEQVSKNPKFLNFVPGVNISSSGDNLGQQYVSPELAVSKGADIIIVGRGIYKASSWKEAAKMYRDACFSAYISSMKGS